MFGFHSQSVGFHSQSVRICSQSVWIRSQSSKKPFPWSNTKWQPWDLKNFKNGQVSYFRAYKIQLPNIQFASVICSCIPFLHGRQWIFFNLKWRSCERIMIVQSLVIFFIIFNEYFILELKNDFLISKFECVVHKKSLVQRTQ